MLAIKDSLVGRLVLCAAASATPNVCTIPCSSMLLLLFIMAVVHIGRQEGFAYDVTQKMLDGDIIANSVCC
jgi:hypothetical protein